MAENKKIFDDFPRVDCEECANWWVNQCDGVPRGSKKRCTAFIASRRVDIPQEIARLKREVKHLTIFLYGFEILFILYMTINLIWG